MEIIRIVSKKNPLSSTYIPHNLILDPIYKIWLCKETYNAFYKLVRQMQSEGLPPIALISGYRSYAYQKMLFDKKVQRIMNEGVEYSIAFERASTVVAMPGCSEHQLGNSIDITPYLMRDYEDPLIRDVEKTAEGQWLKLYAKDYGFILRYPEEKEAITGIIYEPWHYRYVGVNHARKIMRLGISLEEYVEDYLKIY